MTIAGVILSFAWIGAIGWPIALFLGAWRRPAWRRSPLLVVAAAGVSVAWAVCVWAFLIEPRTLVVRHVEIASPAWTGAPVRLGVVSDTHVGGPHVSPARVRRVAVRMNAEAPDFVLLVGDYVNGHLPPAERLARENATIDEGLAAHGGFVAPLGVVAVLGNHDWWYDGPRVEAALRAAGVTVLENAAVRMARPDGDFWVAGLADYESLRAQPSFDAALDAVPADADVVAVGHWPDVFFDAPARVGLTVAGHSHCGQITIPFVARPFAVSPGAAKWPCGAYEESGRQLFVTAGVGTSVLPARLGARPEIVVITLTGTE